MARTITVHIPHELSEQEVKDRLVNGVAEMRTKYASVTSGLRETWNGNRMDFQLSALGQTITGRAEVRPRDVQLQVDLPTLLAMLADKIRPQVEREGRKLLEKK
jgi:hypothetical protein